MNLLMPKYRPNVAAIIINREGEILVCERSNNGRAWQFPQGGVDKGETNIEALYREVLEEVGLEKKYYKVLEEKGGYKYLYPQKVREKKKFDGQKQTYFLCRLKKSAPEIDLGPGGPRLARVQEERLAVEDGAIAVLGEDGHSRGGRVGPSARHTEQGAGQFLGLRPATLNRGPGNFWDSGPPH